MGYGDQMLQLSDLFRSTNPCVQRGKNRTTRDNIDARLILADEQSWVVFWWCSQ
jgi:hypothetical protein